MAVDKAFLLPVVIDETPDDDERAPERFREVQWTRLPGGETPPAFVKRVRRLLAPAEPPVPTPGHAPTGRVPVATRPTKGLASASWSKRALPIAAAVVVLGAVAYLVINKPWVSMQPAASPTPTSAASTAFAPRPHSVAVLPFVNMSGDKEQEYFSDGLTEELLNSLAEINGLQVAARTSAFSFKGQNTDIGLIARRLNVGAILEGSVRRSGNTVRITAQLINAVTGVHLWSKTYDRDLGDVLKLQTDIATSVSSALKVTLLGNEAAKIEVGGTHNPAAFDAYLRASKSSNTYHDGKDLLTAIDAYTEAIRLDPNYALAFADRSLTLSGYAGDSANGPAVRESFDKAHTDAQQAIALAPDLVEGHLALATYLQDGRLDYQQASEEYERALAQAPGNARVLGAYGRFAVSVRRTEAGLVSLRRALVLDPLNRRSHQVIGRELYFARRYNEAIASFQDTLALDPEYPQARVLRGFTYYTLGNFQSARVSCEADLDYWASQACLAVTYHKLGRHADAEAVLAKLKTAQGDDAAYQYAEIYAQWAEPAKAQWLDTAVRLRDPGLLDLLVDPLLARKRKCKLLQYR